MFRDRVHAFTLHLSAIITINHPVVLPQKLVSFKWPFVKLWWNRWTYLQLQL